MQGKGGLDSQTIHEHLEAHPDIPVLAPSEATKHFKDVPKVVGLPEQMGRPTRGEPMGLSQWTGVLKL